MKQIGVSFICDRCGYTDFKFVEVDGDCTNMTINEAIRNCEMPKEWTLDLNNHCKLLCPKCNRELKDTMDVFYNSPVFLKGE